MTDDDSEMLSMGLAFPSPPKSSPNENGYESPLNGAASDEIAEDGAGDDTDSTEDEEVRKRNVLFEVSKQDKKYVYCRPRSKVRILC